MWHEFPLKRVPGLLEARDRELPEGVVAPGARPEVAVEVPHGHPSDTVNVLVRRNHGPAQVLRAVPASLLRSGSRGLFTAALPHVAEGERLDYRVELIRAGQRLMRLPADGSWRTVSGAEGAGIADASDDVAPISGAEAPPHITPPSTARGPEAGSTVPVDPAAALVSSAVAGPRFGYDLKFFARLTADLRAEILGATPEGYRINFFVKGGSVVGPSIDAVIQPEGGDWMCIRPDGIGAVNIKITYETQDGALVLEQAGGIFDIGPDGYRKVAAGDFTGSPPFYATPTWATSHPNWSWMNRRQGFGIGRVVMEKLQVQCDIYIPQVLERLAGG